MKKTGSGEKSRSREQSLDKQPRKTIKENITDPTSLGGNAKVVRGESPIDLSPKQKKLTNDAPSSSEHASNRENVPIRHEATRRAPTFIADGDNSYGSDGTTVTSNRSDESHINLSNPGTSKQTNGKPGMVTGQVTTRMRTKAINDKSTKGVNEVSQPPPLIPMPVRKRPRGINTSCGPPPSKKGKWRKKVPSPFGGGILNPQKNALDMGKRRKLMISRNDSQVVDYCRLVVRHSTSNTTNETAEIPQEHGRI